MRRNLWTLHYYYYWLPLPHCPVTCNTLLLWPHSPPPPLLGPGDNYLTDLEPGDNLMPVIIPIILDTTPLTFYIVVDAGRSQIAPLFCLPRTDGMSCPSHLTPLFQLDLTFICLAPPPDPVVQLPDRRTPIQWQTDRDYYWLDPRPCWTVIRGLTVPALQHACPLRIVVYLLLPFVQCCSLLFPTDKPGRYWAQAGYTPSWLTHYWLLTLFPQWPHHPTRHYTPIMPYTLLLFIVDTISAAARWPPLTGLFPDDITVLTFIYWPPWLLFSVVLFPIRCWTDPRDHGLLTSHYDCYLLYHYPGDLPHAHPVDCWCQITIICWTLLIVYGYVWVGLLLLLKDEHCGDYSIVNCCWWTLLLVVYPQFIVICWLQWYCGQTRTS